MFKNYFKIAWRNLLSHKFYSAIGISGLTIGLTVGVLILIWFQYEVSFNNSVNPKKSIYRVNSTLGTGSNTQIWASSPGPIAAFANSDIPEVKNAVRVMGNWNHSHFTNGDVVFESRKTKYIDPEFFSMFNVRFLSGNRTNPFPDDNSIVITASVAKKIFGSYDPIGKTIKAELKESFTVSGVVEDLPENSSIDVDIFFPLSIMAKEYSGTGYWKSLDSDWGNFNYITYIELAETGLPTKVAHQLSEINKKNDPNAITNLTLDVYTFSDFAKKSFLFCGSPCACLESFRISPGLIDTP